MDRDIFKNIPFKIDVVIHLAAQTSVIRSIEEPEINNLINIDGFKNILNLSRENQIKKIIFASSSLRTEMIRTFHLKKILIN